MKETSLLNEFRRGVRKQVYPHRPNLHTRGSVGCRDPGSAHTASRLKKCAGNYLETGPLSITPFRIPLAAYFSWVRRLTPFLRDQV